MKLRYKIANGIFAILAIAIVVLALVLSHESPCEPAPAVADGTDTMKGIVYTCYGSPDVLQYVDLEKPVAGDGEVLIKVHAAGVNPLDWHYMRGSPYFMRLMSGTGKPDDTRLGVDFAGVVESVGAGVTKFSPGDRVFGGAAGTFSEYVSMPESRGIALMPDNASFEDAAALPIAAITALQAVRDNGALQAGQTVLINGASGGVGTYAVQIAKSIGAVVHGVCSTRNVELVKSLGADHVYDYKKEDYTNSSERYDVIVDMVGNHSLSANRSVMASNGKFVIVGGPKGDWFGPMIKPIGAMISNPFVDQKQSMLLARLTQADMEQLADMMASGVLTTRIDTRYSLADTAEAIRHSETGRARGKIIIDVAGATAD